MPLIMEFGRHALSGLSISTVKSACARLLIRHCLVAIATFSAFSVLCLTNSFPSLSWSHINSGGEHMPQNNLIRGSRALSDYSPDGNANWPASDVCPCSAGSPCRSFERSECTPKVHVDGQSHGCSDGKGNQARGSWSLELTLMNFRYSSANPNRPTKVNADGDTVYVQPSDGQCFCAAHTEDLTAICESSGSFRLWWASYIVTEFSNSTFSALLGRHIGLLTSGGSLAPTAAPTSSPTAPTPAPTAAAPTPPTAVPSFAPSPSPTFKPTMAPTTAPTADTISLCPFLLPASPNDAAVRDGKAVADKLTLKTPSSPTVFDQERAMECADGTAHDIRTDPNACVSRGGRRRCPLQLPVMCAAKTCAGGTDHCCSAQYCRDTSTPANYVNLYHHGDSIYGGRIRTCANYTAKTLIENKGARVVAGDAADAGVQLFGNESTATVRNFVDLGIGYCRSSGGKSKETSIVPVPEAKRSRPHSAWTTTDFFHCKHACLNAASLTVDSPDSTAGQTRCVGIAHRVVDQRCVVYYHGECGTLPSGFQKLSCGTGASVDTSLMPLAVASQAGVQVDTLPANVTAIVGTAKAGRDHACFALRAVETLAYKQTEEAWAWEPSAHVV